MSSSSVVSANEEVTCCSMTVRPLTTHTRYWGPSQTFVTKTGGVKYITDQVSGTYSKVDIGVIIDLYSPLLRPNNHQYSDLPKKIH